MVGRHPASPPHIDSPLSLFFPSSKPGQTGSRLICCTCGGLSDSLTARSGVTAVSDVAYQNGLT